MGSGVARPVLTIAHGPLKGYRIRHNPYTDGERVWMGIDEAEMEPVLADLLTPGMVVYDLEAAVGLYSLQKCRAWWGRRAASLLLSRVPMCFRF